MNGKIYLNLITLETYSIELTKINYLDWWRTWELIGKKRDYPFMLYKNHCAQIKINASKRDSKINKEYGGDILFSILILLVHWRGCNIMKRQSDWR